MEVDITPPPWGRRSNGDERLIEKLQEALDTFNIKIIDREEDEDEQGCLVVVAHVYDNPKDGNLLTLDFSVRVAQPSTGIESFIGPKVRLTDWLFEGGFLSFNFYQELLTEVHFFCSMLHRVAE